MDDPGQVEPGTVGPAIAGIEMKLGEVATKSWCADPIFSRAIGIAPRRRPRPWLRRLVLHTGDQGEQTPAKRTGASSAALKNLLILELPAITLPPEPLEQALTQAISGAQQVVVMGHGRSYLVALVTGDVRPEKVEEEFERLNGASPHYRQIRAFHIEDQSR